MYQPTRVMKPIFGKVFWRNAIFIVLLSIAANSIFLSIMGPRLEPDSSGYIRVALNYVKYGALLENDYYKHTLIPFTERMPGYPIFLSLIYRIFGNDNHTIWFIATSHVFFLSASVFLIFLFSCYFFGMRIGILSGILAALDPWSKINSSMILPDILFFLIINLYLLTAVFIFIKNNHSTKGYHFLLLGAIAGLSAMIRPTTNYVWIVLFPLLLFKYRIKKGLLYFLFFIMGMSMFTGAWLYRNYTEAGFCGLQSISGLSLLWSNHEFTRESTDEEQIKDPQLSWLRDEIASGKNPIKMITPLRREFNLSPYSVDQLMMRLAIENIKEQPVSCIEKYVKNFFKTITTIFNVESSFGGVSFPPVLIWSERISSFFLFFLIPALGFVYAWQRKYDQHILFFFFITIIYFLSLSSLVAGSFRYRLPFHGIIWSLDAFTILVVADKLGLPERCKKYFTRSQS